MAVHFTLNNDFILNFQQLLGHQTKVKTIAKNAISEKMVLIWTSLCIRYLINGSPSPRFDKLPPDLPQLHHAASSVSMRHTDLVGNKSYSSRQRTILIAGVHGI